MDIHVTCGADVDGSRGWVKRLIASIDGKHLAQTHDDDGIGLRVTKVRVS